MQNFGNAPDPEEKKRGEKMIALSDEMVTQQRVANGRQKVAIGIAILALVISLIALFRPH